ncbi:hypothetical protein F2Q69_00041202 [Brassica cretica]|uniref:Uncharacterized protein n=1 Tax=Brassica cretica TaxID=69181 RepID=A0A8S9NQ81_BRACR|nr:hypothetical protein F2Q69_00041202 [Brassica cretica]
MQINQNEVLIGFETKRDANTKSGVIRLQEFTAILMQKDFRQGMNQEFLLVEACMIHGPIANDSRKFVSNVGVHDEKQMVNIRIKLQEESLASSSILDQSVSSLRNQFYLGAYQTTINNSDIPNLSPEDAVERDCLVFRSYIALGMCSVFLFVASILQRRLMNVAETTSQVSLLTLLLTKQSNNGKERAKTDVSVPHAPVRCSFAQRSVQRLMFAQSCYKRSGEQKASDSTEGKDHDDHRKTLFPLTSIANLSPDDAVERDCLVFRSYISLGMCSVFIDERGRDPQVKERAETHVSVPHAPVRVASRKSMLDAIEHEFEGTSTHSSL